MTTKFIRTTAIILLTLNVLGWGSVALPTMLKYSHNFRLESVRSGSMGRTIPVGSLVLTRTEHAYHAGDVISFNDGGAVTTHRIIALKNGAATTKGDANSVVDGVTTPITNILGKVLFSIPYIGYPAAYSHTIYGYLLLILFPGLLATLWEIRTIGRELKTPHIRAAAMLLVLVFTYTSPTFAFFKDQRVVPFGSFSVGDISTARPNFSSGNIDYAHGPEQGDVIPGFFSGTYSVELSNEGVFKTGEKNNGLYVYQSDDQAVTPYLDPNLTLLNGQPLINYLVGQLPPPRYDANPIRFIIRIDPVQSLKLGRQDTNYADGDSGNVFVKLQRLGD